jgi:lipopolysaccharide transport system permease protein
MERVVRSPAGERFRALLSPARMVRDLWTQRELTLRIAQRDIVGRYRNSWLGLLWSIISPLALLAIYTFVFSIVLNIRWGDDGVESRGEFALTLFSGLLVFNLFAEVVNRAPTLVVDNAQYVKKVVFPLEVLVVAGVLTALFNFGVGLLVWLSGWGLIMQSWPHETFVWLPLVLVPVVLTTAGLSWFLASLGVFVRDVRHAVILATQVLFFATPIFYSLERVPLPYRDWMLLNPLTQAVENARDVMMYGQAPAWAQVLLYTVIAAAAALVGYAFFAKSKRAFSDVI